MAQHYSDPSREDDKYTLPDIEVPGCLPDGDPTGPFETEADAIADAQQE